MATKQNYHGPGIIVERFDYKGRHYPGPRGLSFPPWRAGITTCRVTEG